MSNASSRLGEAGIESSSIELQMLVAHASGKDRTWVLAHLTDIGNNSSELDILLERRINREPLAYILGYREFYGRNFKVSKKVLIPRQETEHLVEAALKYIELDGWAVDIGTGSGCIGISLALETNSFNWILTDISPEALEIAKINAKSQNANVRFLNCDLLLTFKPDSLILVVSNPPYISINAPLPPEIDLYEPVRALFAGEDGLEIYRRLIPQSFQALKIGGLLIMEVGYGQMDYVKDLSEWIGFEVKEVLSDLAKIPRVIILKKS